MYDLRGDEGLRRACAEAQKLKADPEWQQQLRAMLEWVRDTPSEEDRATLSFQQRLWEQNSVSSVGQGNISVDAALQDEDFRRWLARTSLQNLPADVAGRVAAFDVLYQELLQRLSKYCARTPRLKVIRVLAALFPLDFTCLADVSRLNAMLIHLFGSSREQPVAGHARIRQRLDEVLGPIDAADLDAVAGRMILPWLLYALVRETEEGPTVSPGKRGEETLKPLPATMRRRGLTAIQGYLQRLLSILEFVREDGATREELLEYLRTSNPTLKDSSLSMSINVVRSEFGLLRHEGDRYLPNERGLALLDSRDPDVLRDWLLTRVLGVDHVLHRLNQKPCGKDELVALLQRANPGWTADFAPTMMLSWLRVLDLVQREASGAHSLTQRGCDWADLITWTPEFLQEEGGEEPVDETIMVVEHPIARPDFAKIYKAVSEMGLFDEGLVSALHAGLWANERRHFAVLTGLSGAGKTLLARAYGEALVGGAEAATKRLKIIPVQPGWYDPTPLFGYVNPLGKGTYETTPFLELLHHAGQEPEQPHVAVLDEFNLSHPEQYLAPLLSAMETGQAIELHTKGDRYDGVPARTPYPKNLVIIGTVNMDETTMGLSDKVLDRAFVFEFWDVDVTKWPKWDECRVTSRDRDRLREILAELGTILRPARLHFGWRTVDEIVGFLNQAAAIGNGFSFETSLDRAVCAKILPKLRGDDSARFRTSLKGSIDLLRRCGLRESTRKVEELQVDLETTGSARFWR